MEQEAYRDAWDEGSFFDKLRTWGGKVPGVRDLVALYYCMRDPATPLQVKAAISGCIGYFVSPLDAMPDPMFADDGAVISSTLVLADVYITEEHEQKARTFFEDCNR